MLLVLVLIGAAVGAPMRYLVDRWVQSSHETPFPWGTLTVNVAGSFVLGFLAGLPAHAGVTALVGTGLCATFTTYSTFSYETVRLVQDGVRFYAFVNIVASLSAGLGSVYLGLLLAGAVTAGVGA